MEGRMYIKSKTKSGNPLRIKIDVKEHHVVITKYVYSKKLLKFFEIDNKFKSMFGRKLYYQVTVFSKEDFILLYPIARMNGLEDLINE